MKTALIAGATGLIGKQVLGRLLASKRYTTVVTLTRSTFATDHPKFRNIVTDFHHPEVILSGIHADDVFCCLGTTMAKAGSREKFYEVDFQFPLSLAKATSGLGAKQFLLVSALGADKSSSIYYNSVKGGVETAVRAVPFETLHIFRPSLLLGERHEKRPGEDVAKLLYRIFAFAIPEKYKAISAEKVADAMLTHASQDQKGIFVHESREMQKSEISSR